MAAPAAAASADVAAPVPDRIDANGYLRQAPDDGELFDWLWMGDGTPMESGDMSYEAVSRSNKETIAVGDFVLLMPDGKEKQCEVAQVLSLYEREGEEDEPDKMFTARWCFRKEDFTKAALKKISPLRSEEGREVWPSDKSDPDNMIDSIERRCSVTWVPLDSDEYKEVIKTPFSFFYSRDFNPAKSTFTIAKQPVQEQPAEDGGAEDGGADAAASDAPPPEPAANAAGAPPPRKRKGGPTVAQLAADLAETQRRVVSLETQVVALKALVGERAQHEAQAAAPC